MAIQTDQQLLEIAQAAASAGALALKKHWGKLEQVRCKGRPGDLVTEADLAAEAAVLEVLQQHTPEIGVLAEEAGRQGPAGALQWCVDPLDGTTNYAHGFPLFACSVGLLKNGQPHLGAIEAPALQQSYWGGIGLGAYCNGEQLKVSGCDQLANALLVTGFAYDRFEVQNNNYTEFCYFSHRCHGVRRGGAASLDLAFVAAGRLDGYWERGLQPWDLAAGAALILAAGGVVCDYNSTSLNLNNGRVLACSPALLQPLVEGLKSCEPMPGEIYGASFPPIAS